MYGRDTSGVVKRSVRPPARYGPMSIKAVRYWLLTSPRSSIVPPARSGPAIVTGRCPHVSAGVTPTPSAASASCSGAIGRARNGGRPSMTCSPGASAASAVTNRDVVPARRAGSTAGPLSNPAGPPPLTTTPPSMRPTPTPSTSRQSSIAATSSPSGTSRSTVVPEARQAHTRARLAMLFEPGTSTVASTGRSRVRTRTTRIRPAAARPGGSRGPADRHGTAPPRSRRRARRRRPCCPRRCGPPRSWRC